MLRDIFKYYIKDKTSIITSAPGNGATSFALYLANIITEQNKYVIYFNIDNGINREFVKNYYNKVYNNCIFINTNIEIFFEFLDFINYDINHIIIDPADPMMISKSKLLLLQSILKNRNIGLTCTAQIRADPNKGGKIYSTIENILPFDNSIWIRNVSETSDIIYKKYIDIFDSKRSGNNYIARHIAKFTKEGQVLDV